VVNLPRPEVVNLIGASNHLQSCFLIYRLNCIWQQSYKKSGAGKAHVKRSLEKKLQPFPEWDRLSNNGTETVIQFD
jgi:hypothetical protein